ncbi:MAG TPA: pyridoxal phosphate-dependent aminotransferase [Dehalococcoidia bacterium]|jgi:aspartate aminotransferase|nr:pyridoxal phosphate-dependent aminotransferase [Dehalococcoidia bacterium]|tara:strand:- start:1674 stop:2864 length:1191 start_codon:yes stop_codon:yes gene_type:complete
MSVSEKIKTFIENGGWIRKMFESGITLKQEFGEDNVFDLSLGNPIIEPPSQFQSALLKLAQNPIPGMHRYMPNAGYIETREAIAKTINSDSGLSLTSQHLVMTCGAAAGLNVILKSLLNTGEEVIILSPYFVEYEYYIDNHSGVSIVVPTNSDFTPDLLALEKAISPLTKAIIINSPNNPTGVVYGESTYSNISNLLNKKQNEYKTKIYLISDEPYRKITFSGVQCPNWFNYYDNSLVVHSHAKDLALPGERIGYIAVSPKSYDAETLINALTFSNRILGFVNAPALMQNLIKSLQTASVDSSIYERKMNFLYNELTNMGYEIIKPQGAFYLFPKSPLTDDSAFSEELLKENVLVVPGRGFGTPGYFRISYCVEDKVIEGSLHGFRKMAQKYNLKS